MILRNVVSQGEEGKTELGKVHKPAEQAAPREATLQHAAREQIAREHVFRKNEHRLRVSRGT
jgi:hypothetical protein